MNLTTLGIVPATFKSFMMTYVTNVLADFPANSVALIVHPNRAGHQEGGRTGTFFHFICISMCHCFLKQSHGQTRFLRYTAFHDHNSITTPAQLRLLASAPTANCRRSSKKEPSEVKEEDHSSVKQDEGSDDEEGGEQKDEVDDVQVRDIRYNLETLSKNQTLVGVVSKLSIILILILLFDIECWV